MRRSFFDFFRRRRNANEKKPTHTEKKPNTDRINPELREHSQFTLNEIDIFPGGKVSIGSLVLRMAKGADPTNPKEITGAGEVVTVSNESGKVRTILLRTHDPDISGGLSFRKVAPGKMIARIEDDSKLVPFRFKNFQSLRS